MPKSIIVGDNNESNIIISDVVNSKIEVIISSWKGSNKDKEERLRKYYQSLATKFTKKGILGNQEIALSQIYVEPKFDFEDETELTIRQQSRDLSIHKYVESWKLKTLSSKPLIVLGQPGQGKSSFCQKLLYDHFIENKEKDSSIYFLRLRSIKNIEDFVKDPIETIIQRLSKMPSNLILESIDLKNSLLILDGLDELQMIADYEASKIESFIKTLYDDLKSNFENLQIIITSRFHYFNKKNIYGYAKVISLRGFGRDEQIHWAKKYQTLYSGKTFMLEEKINKVYLERRKYSYLFELMAQPIILHIIASLEVDLTEVDNRAKIYDKLFSSLIEREQNKKYRNKIVPDKIKLRTFLQEVGFSIFKNEKDFITQQGVKEVIIKNKITSIDSPDFEAMHKALLLSFYFQDSNEEEDENGNYAIEFVHKSFGEYLAAEKIWNDIVQLCLKEEFDFEALISNMNELFLRKEISLEVFDYFLELIKNSDVEIKAKVYSIFIGNAKNFIEDKYKNMYSGTYGRLSLFYYYFLILMNTKEPYKQIFDEEKFGILVNWVKKRFSKEKAILNFNDIISHHLFKIKVKSFFLFSNYFKKRSINSDSGGSGGTKGFLLDFSKWQLKDLDLSGIILDNINFSNTQLENVTFYNSELKGCNFGNSSLINCFFVFSNLDGSFFDSAKVKNCEFKIAKVIHASFEEAEVENVNFSAVLFNGTNFKRTNLKESSFIHCDFTFSLNLSKKNFQGTKRFEQNIGLSEKTVKNIIPK